MVPDWAATVTLAQQGNLVAFDTLVRRFQHMAVGYAYSLLGDFELAQDAAQEAFIQAYLNLQALQEPIAFPAWLRRIVFGQCGRFTRGKRRPAVPLDDALELADPLGTPLESLQQREMRDAVLTALRALPEHERAATTLFYIDGYSMAEVGEFLEVPVSTVKNRLHSARKKLHERMVGEMEEALKRHAPGDDLGRRVKKILEGLERTPWESIYLCTEGSLLSCLRYMQEDVTLPFLMGVSGSAFKFLWHPDSSPDLVSLLLLGEEPIRRVLGALGYGYTYLPGSRHPERVVLIDSSSMSYDFRYNPAAADPAQEATRERYRELIVQNIEAGRPVMALGISGPPEPCVITGYDKGGDVLYGKSYFQEVEQGYFRAEGWFENCEGLLLFGERRPRPSRRQVLVDSLQWAIELSRTPRRDTVRPIRADGGLWHYAGLAAYGPLAAEFQREERFVDDRAVLSPNIERTMYDGVWLLLTTRENAAQFLAGFAGDGLPGADALNRAAEAYTEEARVLRSATAWMPIEASEKCLVIAKPAVRRELRRIVLEAKLIEERAVTHLEQAYQALL